MLKVGPGDVVRVVSWEAMRPCAPMLLYTPTLSPARRLVVRGGCHVSRRRCHVPGSAGRSPTYWRYRYDTLRQRRTPPDVREQSATHCRLEARVGLHSRTLQHFEGCGARQACRPVSPRGPRNPRIATHLPHVTYAHRLAYLRNACWGKFGWQIPLFVVPDTTF